MKPNAPKPNLQATTDVPLLAGRYSLLNKLGEGGMGAVFHARDTKLDRAVAVKMLPAGSTPDGDAVARFQREAKALARLAHPGIIQAFDSGDEGGRPFLVMELVEGQSLAAVLRDQGRVTPARAADFAYQAALALHHAHQSGLVHRDVKPSNLLLSADGRVRLLDLGLARFLQDQVGDGALTREGVGMGTPDYAAPEQFRDAHKADMRSDIYALGCTLYHLIAGRVPFPGSSLSEKVTAHETKEPTPLEELCPEVPAGVASAVRRMMAKRPADRFHTMAEVAEVLLPHVAGSSASFPQIRTTSTWTGAQPLTMPMLPRRRPLGRWLAIGALAALVLLGVGLAVGWFRSRGAETTPITGSLQIEIPKVPEPADPGNPKPPVEPGKQQPYFADPNVLTVSQKAEDGGKYRTISAALKEVNAGQTVLVLDEGTYEESLVLSQPSRYKEVTLAAMRRATLAIPGGTYIGVKIANVSGFGLRGFRVKGDDSVTGLIVAVGQVSGLSLDDLDLHIPAGKNGTGVSLEGVCPKSGMPPASVRHCRFRGGDTGLRLSGMPTPSSNLVIQENTFTGVNRSLVISGEVSRSRIIANRFIGASECGIHLVHMGEKADGLVLANNTFTECGFAVRLADTGPKGHGIRLSNNLILGSAQLDMIFLDWIGIGDPKPGDGKSVGKSWRLDHNWREVKEPAASDPLAQAWIPPDPRNGDVCREKIEGVNRDSKSPDFLLPEKGSPLAAAGAGNEDPSLPRYVGALPPNGIEPWDWDRAARMPKDAQLLTVSKTSSGGGKYRTINEALKAAKPWTTIRVLDTETYQETIALDQKEQQEGISLEAPKRAILLLAGAARQILTVRDVPSVRVSGFVFRQAEGAKDQLIRSLVHVRGGCSGLKLEGLEFRPVHMVRSVVLQDVVGEGGAPVSIARCRIVSGGPSEGILVAGPSQSSSTPSQYIAIRDNRIAGVVRGIHVQGALADVLISGNRLTDCLQEGIGIEDLTPSAARLLIANNTLLNCESGLRGWLNRTFDLKAGQVEARNNLILDNALGDMIVAVRGEDGLGLPSQEKANRAAQVWRFGGNWRDLTGTANLIPLAPSDHKLDASFRLPRNPSLADFLRPPSDSPLAAGGAGNGDPLLPPYVGAVSPEGVEPWDWDRTWQALVKKTEGKK